MTEEWSWEKGKELKGSGVLVKKGFIIKFKHVDELKFKIKGRFSKESKGTESSKDVLYFKLGVEEIRYEHLVVSVVEIIMNALWEVNIEDVEKAQMNSHPLKKKDILEDMAKKIVDGDKMKRLYLKIQGQNQAAVVNLSVHKKHDLKGEIEFGSPMAIKDVERFTKELKPLTKLFVKEEIKVGKRGKNKDDKSGPLEYGGPGQEPVKWYGVHGRG